MPIDDLSGELTVTTRDKERDRWIRDYSFHKPDDATAPGTEPYIQASTVGDLVMPLYHDIKVVADATDPTKIGGAELTRRAEADGVVQLEAVGAAGAVEIGAAVGGGTIFVGDALVVNGVRFKCNATALYFDGDEVPIIGIDTGLATNFAAGTVLAWDPPRPGIETLCTIVEQVDGSGLSGGRPKETEDEYRARWILEKQRRAASGNDAEIQETAEKTPGVSVQKCFTIPGCLGPGTTCLVFTVKPDSSTSSRLPNSTERAAVLAYVKGVMPADDGIFMAIGLAQPVNVALAVTWDSSAIGWADQTTWPAFYSASGQAIVVSSATDSLHFVLKTFNSSYTSITSPVAGQTIALYDQGNASFQRKKLLSVTGTGPWTVVCDTSNGASDQTYTPVVGQRVSPWSDSLQDLIEPIAKFFQTLGPGEQFASFFDPGQRQHRQPENPKNWPSVISNKGIEVAINATSIFDVNVQEPTLPHSTTVGTPAVTAYLQELGEISAFPL